MVTTWTYNDPNGWDSIDLRVDDDTIAFIELTVGEISESCSIEIPIDKAIELAVAIIKWATGK